MIKRIKEKPGYKYLALLGTIIVVLGVLNSTSPEHSISTGRTVLVCETNTGWHEINASKNPVYIGEEDVWAWDGGFSHNCYLEPRHP